LGFWHFVTGILFDASKDSLPYASAVGACAFAAQWPSALELLEEMTERRLPAIAAYNAAIMACQRASMFDQALPLGPGFLAFLFYLIFAGWISTWDIMGIELEYQWNIDGIS
jgi:hypothetical protein